MALCQMTFMSSRLMIMTSPFRLGIRLGALLALDVPGKLGSRPGRQQDSIASRGKPSHIRPTRRRGPDRLKRPAGEVAAQLISVCSL